MLDTLRRLFRRESLAITPVVGHAPTDVTELTSADIMYVLNRDYPPAIVGETALLPNLPRGAETRIAIELGCSRGYVSRVARGIGYHVEGKP